MVVYSPPPPPGCIVKFRTPSGAHPGDPGPAQDVDKALGTHTHTHTKFSKGSLSGWVEVLKYSAAGRPGAAVVNTGLREEEGRVRAWRSVPAPEVREGMLWAGVRATGCASGSVGSGFPTPAAS